MNFHSVDDLVMALSEIPDNVHVLKTVVGNTKIVHNILNTNYKNKGIYKYLL